MAQVSSIPLRGYITTIDLALLRELIRNDSARGHDGDINRVLAQTVIDCLFESIPVRASLPYKQVDIALTLRLLGVETIQSCSRYGTDVRKFSERYIIRLARLLRVGILPTVVG